MNSTLHYVGLDLHKRTISLCVKTADGTIVEEKTLAARPIALKQWAEEQATPWVGAMEATIFTGWVYDVLKPLAQELKVAHPQMMKAITCAKKKSDQIDPRKLADGVRCGFLPECYMAPGPIRELRRVLRFRNLLLRQTVRMKNRIAGLLMETAVDYNKKQLHRKKYFSELMESLEEVPDSVIDLLHLSRSMMETFNQTQKRLLRALEQHDDLRERMERLKTVPSIGAVTGLTWALEVGEPQRFSSVGKAYSYCGLTSALISSGGKEHRGPISKQRNKYLQTVLIEAAKLAPRLNAELKALHDREVERGHPNRATLVVARKLVAYLLAVDKSGKPFTPRSAQPAAVAAG